MSAFVWLFVALLAFLLIGFFAFMAYRDEKEIDDDLRKADDIKN